MDYYLKLSQMPSKSSARRPPEDFLDVWIDFDFMQIDARELRRFLNEQCEFKLIDISPVIINRNITTKIRFIRRRRRSNWRSLIREIETNLQKYLGPMEEVIAIPS